MNQEEYEKLIDKMYHNKIELGKVKYCGCTCCGSLFNPKLISEWIDEGDAYNYVCNADGKVVKKLETQFTAKCPFCNDDNIMPLGNEKKVAKDLLKKILIYECQDNFILKERFEYKKENGEERVNIQDYCSIPRK